MDYGVVSNGGNNEIKLKKLIENVGDISLNKDITLIVIPAINFNVSLSDMNAYIQIRGKVKFDNIIMKDIGSYDEIGLLVGKKFTLNISDSTGGVSAGIKNLTFSNCYIFECE